ERLPGDPRNFREITEADLRRAARLVIKVRDEIDPQIRIGTPEGDFHIAITLPPDDYGRRNVLRALALFMAWKQALAFTFASEIYQPDAVYCVGISPKERCACISRIKREPKPWTTKNFGEVEWLPESSIDPMMIDLLPSGAREMTAKDLATVDKWFGARGKFPAVHIPTGEIGQ
ncbi:MAG: hypothetical protein WBX25_32620, partial [Rhodomicrobium sp.]